MILGWSSTKIGQIVPLRCTRWLPELKIEKRLNDISSVTAWPILTKLHRNDRWVSLYQNWSNRSAPLHKMAAKAKNRNTFKQLRLLNCLADFDETSQEMVPLRCTRCPQGLCTNGSAFSAQLVTCGHWTQVSDLGPSWPSCFPSADQTHKLWDESWLWYPLLILLKRNLIFDLKNWSLYLT